MADPCSRATGGWSCGRCSHDTSGRAGACVFTVLSTARYVANDFL
jgi:hypothetical protein